MKWIILTFAILNSAASYAATPTHSACDQLLNSFAQKPSSLNSFESDFQSLLLKSAFNSPQGKEVVQKIVSNLQKIKTKTGLLIPAKTTCLSQDLSAAVQYADFIETLSKNADRGQLCDAMIAFELVQKQISLGRSPTDAQTAAIMAAEHCGLVQPRIADAVRLLGKNGKLTKPSCN